MKAYIKIKTLNNASKDNDCLMYLQCEHILGVSESTSLDKRQRPEINSMLYCTFGQFASSDSAATVMEKIKQAESAVPDETQA